MQQRLEARAQRRAAHFKQLDADGDGKLSREEYLTAAKAAYEQRDADGDGKITVWEFRARPFWDE
ncbi:MAG TPA: hypothetical protein VE631_03015, partial [Alphaproteobacteria bacterium]|nr:hypothetical protein [Alphaproteobacteria bacterium]